METGGERVGGKGAGEGGDHTPNRGLGLTIAGLAYVETRGERGGGRGGVGHADSNHDNIEPGTNESVKNLLFSLFRGVEWYLCDLAELHWSSCQRWPGQGGGQDS